MNSSYEIHRYASKQNLALAAAQEIVRVLNEAIRENGIASLCLSGGSTPRSVYQLLGAEPLRGMIEWERVHVFWGDERCVLPTSDESNFKMVRESLLEFVTLPTVNIHRIRSEENPEAAAALYEQELRQFFFRTSLPRFDLMLLGMGEDGHTASLFPDTAVLEEQSAFVASTYVQRLKTSRVTITFPVINNSRHIFILVSGSSKARMIKNVLTEKNTVFPIQRVSLANGIVRWFLDDDAAVFLHD